jgi:uncharacterized delta-60 repeat protein
LTGTCLDATFGGHGLVLTNTDGSVPEVHDLDGASAVKQLTDGTSKLVAMGVTTDPQTLHQGIAVVRYNVDGSLDAMFGSGGISKAFISSNQPDGVRDGTIDINGNVLALVYVNGTTVVARFTYAGLLDASFNSVGYSAPLNVDPRAMLLQPDGKILVAGEVIIRKSLTAAIVRLNADGSPDTTFGSNGEVIISSLAVPYALALQSVNSQPYLLAGGQTTTGNFGIVRVSLSGTLDSTFGASGLATTNVCGFGGRIDTLALDAAGNILAGGIALAVSGGAQKIALARFASNGALDTTFGSARTGQTLLDFYGSNNFATSVVPLPDGSGGFLIAGYADKSVGTSILHYLVLAKYDAYGSLNTVFGSGGAVAIDFGGGNNTMPSVGSSSLLIQLDGKVVIAGDVGFASGPNAGYNFGLARLWP